MNTEIKTFYDCMTSLDGGTMRSWPERMHITDQVLHPSYMYMLEVVFAEVWADRKIAVVELLGRNFDPAHIGPLVAETVARMAHQGRIAGQVGFHADQKNWAAFQQNLPKPPQWRDMQQKYWPTPVGGKVTDWSNLEAWQRKQNAS